MKKLILLLCVLLFTACSSSKCDDNTNLLSVTFVQEGGHVGDYEGEIIKGVEPEHSLSYNEFPQSERSGFTLMGWTTVEGSNVADFSTSNVIEENTTVYAIWIPEGEDSYVVAFHRNTSFPVLIPRVSYLMSHGNPLSVPVYEGSPDNGDILGTVRLEEGTVIGRFLPQLGDTPMIHFVGWALENDATVPDFDAFEPVEHDLDLFAVWALVTEIWTVSYYSDGVLVDTAQVSNGQTVSSLPPSPVKAGYVFNGWSTSSGGEMMDFTAATPVHSDISVNAIWDIVEEDKKLVVFHSDKTNQYTYMKVDNNTSFGDDLPALLSDPTHKFLGWSTDQNAQQPNFFADTIVTSDLDVYAIWQVTVLMRTVTFFNGDVFVGEETVPNGNTLSTMPEDPTRDGYTFLGWADSKSATVPNFTHSSVILQNLSVYAVWQVKEIIMYDVVFYFNDGTDRSVTRSVAEGGTLGNSFPTLSDTKLHTFEGWGESANATTPSITRDTVINSDLKVYAIWVPITADRDIYFYTTHSALYDTRTVTNGQTLPDADFPANPSRDGYNFLGWSTTADDDNIDFNSSFIITDNIYVYAVWGEAPKILYRITYHTDTADILKSVQENTAVGNAYLILPDNSTAVFKGWSTIPNATTVNFTENTIVTADVDVYPIFDPRDFTVTFNMNGGNGENIVKTLNGSGYITDFPANPTYPDPMFYFGGWNTRADGSGTAFTRNTKVTSSMTVYAMWGFGIKDLTEIDDLDGTYVLIADPNPTGVQEPVGPFTGILYGGGHTVTKNGSLDCKDDRSGLFSVLDGAKIYDLNIMSNLNQFTPCRYVGGLAGEMINGAYVENINVRGSVNAGAAEFIGGVVGSADNSNVIKCSFTATIQTVDQTAVYTLTSVGGIAGRSGGEAGMLRYNFTSGNINVVTNKTAVAGGTVGTADSGQVMENHSQMDIQSQTTSAAGESLSGGIAGIVNSGATVKQSYFNNNAMATGRGRSVSGGIAARLAGRVIESYSNGNTNAISQTNSAGAGSGGIAGEMTSTGSINRVTSESGSTSSQAQGVAGASGRISGTDNTNISAAFANSAMSVNNATVTGTATDKNGEDTDLNDMMTESFFTSTTLGWDFNATWKMGGQYPALLMVDQ